MPTSRPAYQPDESFARQLDADDPLAGCRQRFHLPSRADGSPLIYFCSHSLGLQPKNVRDVVEQELDAWARLGVEGHFKGDTPWYTYQELLREPTARLVGARPDEVITMNGLTINLHLMFATFYRPDRTGRHKVLMEEPAFPSDLYAVKSHISHHGLAPSEALVTVGPRPGEQLLRQEDLEEQFDRHGQQVAVVWINAINFLTGQYLDVPRLVESAHRHGCLLGLDLAHAAGNVPLQLHDWGVDFAVWCTYKYLCSGPGAIAGCFVHERHGRNAELGRLAGWWGNDPATRFQMQLQPEFIPKTGADGWQVSNPPILALAPLRAALAILDEVGMALLRDKSERLTGYMEYLLNRLPPGRVEIVTPRESDRRGCQLSLVIPDGSRELFRALEAVGVVADFREPSTIRVAPVPLYNTFVEVWKFADILARQLS